MAGDTARDELLARWLADHSWSKECSGRMRKSARMSCTTRHGFRVTWCGGLIRASDIQNCRTLLPGIHDIALMEDRAMRRISSQQIADRLRHGMVSEAPVNETIQRMAKVIDAHNANDPLDRPMTCHLDASPASRATKARALEARLQSGGYTVPLPHRFGFRS